MVYTKVDFKAIHSFLPTFAQYHTILTTIAE